MADTSRFNLGNGYSEPEWMPAVRLIERHSQHCSQRIFKELENRIIHYHSSDEKEMAKYDKDNDNGGSYTIGYAKDAIWADK